MSIINAIEVVAETCCSCVTMQIINWNEPQVCPVWSVFTVRMKKAWVLSYPWSAQWRLWSDWMDAQADLSLLWVHSHFVGFVMLRLKLFDAEFVAISELGLSSEPYNLVILDIHLLIYASC